MSEQHHGVQGWGENMWWHHQQQQQQNYVAQQQHPQNQQMLHHDVPCSSADNTNAQMYTYKMTNSYQNGPASPVGAMGVRGYEYSRPGDGMTGGNPTMNMPAPASQWWYPDNNMQQRNMHTPLPQSESQSRLEEAQRLHEAQLQHHQQQQQQQQVLQQQQQQLTNNRRMPRAKGDAKPRGRMSAYAFFVQTCSEEHKKKHPDENVIFAEFSKKCAERWKTMLDKEKKRFREMAENDKKRYDSEMQNYTPAKGEKRGKKRKQMKDPNAPKRSLSAFFWFSNDERPKVKEHNPEYGVGDVAKELGRRWADCTPEEKSKYEALADEDKARYEKEMTAYKKKTNPAAPPPPVPEPEDVEEDEENEEDEDD